MLLKDKLFVEAAEAMEVAAKLPRFPGDPSPVFPYLEKLFQRVWGECNVEGGGFRPACECPPCRAFRTEGVEKGKDQLEKVLSLAKQNLAASRGEVDVLMV